MSDVVISCTCCGYQLVFPEGSAAMRCPACHTHNARPRSTGDTLLTLQRAVDQRLACDFHNAELSYQQVLLYRPDEHEALWGRLLCHYGVEYVEDPVSKRRMPTVHTVQPKPLQEQADFRRACQFAPEAIRIQYEQDASYIDNAQANIRQLARSCQPYDVFLCHKTTKPGSSDYTQDFHRASQLYHFLKDQGVRVFFAPECLQNAAGANYEAGIYHALQTAKVMLLVCSRADYLTSAWVRSEWSRFLDLVDNAPARRIVPLLYDHFSPSNLPQPFIFRRIQGMDMTAITAPQTLLALVAGAVASEAAARADMPKAKPVKAAPRATADVPKAAAPAEKAPREYAPASHFKTNRVGNEIIITKYIGPGGTVHIPPEIDGLPVTQIGPSAFWPTWKADKKTNHVSIPSSVILIGDSAFHSCLKLFTVELSEGLRSIGSHAFDCCISITSLHLPDSIQEIGRYCFANAYQLREINCPKSLKVIRESAFAGRTSLSVETLQPFEAKLERGFLKSLRY